MSSERVVSEHKIGLLPLILMTTALFMTMRNMPMMAETGMQMVFFNTVTVFAFLLPIALISAELATGWPKNGVFHWVEAAFGTPVGFVAVFLQWIQSIFGITSIVAFVASSFAYAIDPSLSTNRYFITIAILVVYWGATFANFKGTRVSEIISSYAVMIGVYFPATVLIVASLFFISSGGPIQLDDSANISNWLPSLNNQNNLVLFMSFIFGFVGIEVSACHAVEVKDVQKNYPIAIFVAAILGFTVTLLGGLAVATVLPKTEISSIDGTMQAFSAFYHYFGLQWLISITALFVALGAAGQVSTWIVGPVKGLWAAARSGLLPPAFRKANKHNVPTPLLTLQAFLISLIALSFLLANDVNTVFLLLTTTAVLLYSLMYLMMFIAAIRLRYTHPHIDRPYKVPGGNWGIWVLGVIGSCTALSCFSIGFIQPQGLGMPQHTYEVLMAIASGCAILLPLLIWLRSNTKKRD